MQHPLLSIFDTTLRDGEQAPGNAMNVEAKVAIGIALMSLGVNTIETGFPAAARSDFDATRKLAAQAKSTTLCAFARACRSDIQFAFDALQNAPRSQIEVLTTVSDIHLRLKRGISRAEALAEARDAVGFAIDLGVHEVSVAPEDASRADRRFLREMIETVLDVGATTIVVPDTVGACLPEEFGDLITEIRQWIGPAIRISAHAHNDLGLATANTLAAVLAGADECQVTLCGIGERAGNAALEEVIAVVHAKQNVFKRSTTVDTQQISTACGLLTRTIGLPLARSKAIIGANAFSTAAGIHQSGMLRDPRTYEYLNPESFGAKRTMVFARHSGRQALRAKANMLGIAVDDAKLDQIYEELVNNDTMVVFTDQDLLSVMKRQTPTAV
jgi:2-isopropylmalate synthase